MIDVKIGGRAFSVMNMERRPFRVDAAQTALLQELGLDAADLLPGDEEDPMRYISRLQGAVIKSQRIPDLLSHYLLPIGKTEADWTPELARETAQHIADADTEEDRRLIYDLAAEFVFHFFRRGVDLLGISLSYLEHGASIQARIPSSAGRSTFRRGMRSFGRWLVSTMTRHRRWPAGRSARA